jgi:hypothetical protein
LEPETFKRNSKALATTLQALIHKGTVNLVYLMIIHPDGVRHIIGRYHKAKENYENSNISPCKNAVFKTSCKRNQNPSRYYYNNL